ncbi:MAG: ABC transporter ATP-binding protein [Gorillibacterium sp.]|nr:ABC transporter ATP-binding protein [Gorillibacterium sp.]
MNFVSIKDISKRYEETLSVDHLTLNIEEGEIFGLLGPNGAGKSTTIRMICGLLKPSGGKITVNGFDTNKNLLEVKRSIGLVPQELAIYPSLTARENVTYFARLYGMSGAKLKLRVSEALEFVGLIDRQHIKPEQYSGGMKRRLNIACALAHQPKLIIMDEPTVGIDPQSRNHILDSVKELNRLGSTIIYTSHYMEEVEAISTRVGILDQGQLIALGTKEELVRQVSSEEKLQIQVVQISELAIKELEAHPRISKVILAENVIELHLGSAQTYLQDILYILSKHQVSIQSVVRVEPDLESLFLSLTGRTLRD